MPSKPGRPTGPLYIDTSALLKLYFPEVESDDVNALLRGRRDVVVSQLCVTELVSAIARRCREGRLEKHAALVVQRAVLEHVEIGAYACVGLAPNDHREAERMLLRSESSLRSADALHLAVAKSARAARIVTFDRRMAEAASANAFPTLPK